VTVTFTELLVTLLKLDVVTFIGKVTFIGEVKFIQTKYVTGVKVTIAYKLGSAFHWNATKLAPYPQRESERGRHDAESKKDAEPSLGPIIIVVEFQYINRLAFEGVDKKT